VTSSFADDTELDAIAAQVRSSSPLTDAELTSLLHEARRAPAGPAGASLIESKLNGASAVGFDQHPGRGSLQAHRNVIDDE